MSNPIQVSDDSFDDNVLRAEGPVLVDYWADWCAPCKTVGPLVDAATDRYAGHLTVAKLDVDANPDTPARYGIRGIPTLMLFRDGEPVETQVGAVSQGQLDAFIEQYL